uniref:hypothetical protein n=1 Tax=Candidatus Ichthyocystis sparus TaxID=1561004 RepID=UPI00159ECF97
GMFYGTSNFGVVLNMVSQLSAVRESLLVSQELERSIATQEGVRTRWCESTRTKSRSRIRWSEGTRDEFR